MTERVEPRGGRRGLAALVAVVGLALLTAWGMGPARNRIEKDLRKRSLAVLKDAGFPDLDVKYRGRDARIIGSVPSDEVRQQVHDLVRDRRGNRHVFDPQVAAPSASIGSLDWAAEISGGKVVLRGRVASETERAAIIERLAGLVGRDNIDDQMTVDPAAASLGAESAGAYAELVGRMAATGVAQGRVGFDGRTVTLAGELPNRAAVDQLTGLAATLAGERGQVTNTMTVSTAVTVPPVETTAAPTTVAAATTTPAVTTTVASPTTVATETTAVAAATTTTAAQPSETTAPEETTTTLDPETAQPRAQVEAILRLRTIEFDRGSAELTPAGRATVSEVAKVLAGFPDVEIGVEGHTDNRGSTELNDRLSKARADSVRAALIAEGIEGSRITATGFGATQPIASNLNEQGRARNRRIEFVLVKE